MDADRPPASEVTDAELAVLKALWRRRRATIRELTDELYPGGGASHYATVQKLLERLESKGCVGRRRHRRVNVYRPRVDRRTLIARRLQATADRLCDGSLAPLLSHLVGAADARQLSDRDLAALRALVGRLEEDGAGGEGR
ncbi:MAG: BlaI/MecI/CopY family transcriptional regulator [Acidobacteria bacterium]|nr:MAG: BlaI/MecI/CopY family transcriptional regulator [Acidobacteriota bacterium]